MLEKLRELAAPADLSLIHLRGTAKFSAAPLTAVYAGNRSNLAFLSNLFFEEADAETARGHFHPLQLRAALARESANADLLLLELPPLWSPLLPHAQQHIRFPAWVRQEIHLPASSRDTPWIVSREFDREVARLTRRNHYMIDVTTSRADMEVFFDQFYRPYIQSRFGAGSFVASRDRFMTRCKDQMLVRLHAGERWVAGMLIKEKRHSLRFGWFGSVHTPPLPGASAALDLFAIRRARERGIRRVILGDSRPCLSDGVVRYKRRLGGRFVDVLFPKPVLCIGVRRWNDAIAECLTKQPLITIRRGRPFVHRVVRAAHGPVLTLEPLDFPEITRKGPEGD